MVQSPARLPLAGVFWMQAERRTHSSSLSVVAPPRVSSRRATSECCHCFVRLQACPWLNHPGLMRQGPLQVRRLRARAQLSASQSLPLCLLCGRAASVTGRMRSRVRFGGGRRSRASEQEECPRPVAGAVHQNWHLGVSWRGLCALNSEGRERERGEWEEGGGHGKRGERDGECTDRLWLALALGRDLWQAGWC